MRKPVTMDYSEEISYANEGAMVSSAIALCCWALNLAWRDPGDAPDIEPGEL